MVTASPRWCPRCRDTTLHNCQGECSRCDGIELFVLPDKDSIQARLLDMLREREAGPKCPACRGKGKTYTPAPNGAIGFSESMCLRCIGYGKIPWREVGAHECLDEETDDLLKPTVPAAP